MSRKNRRLTLVLSPPRAPAKKPERKLYGWQADKAMLQIQEDPNETWLRYQAHSYLGRPVGIEEARELFSRIDVHTREPIQEKQRKPWWQRLLGVLVE